MLVVSAYKYNQVGFSGSLQSLKPQRILHLSIPGPIGGIAFLVFNFHLFAGNLSNGINRHHLIPCLNTRTATIFSEAKIGVLTHNKNPVIARFIYGQNISIILQQHNALLLNGESIGRMLRRVARAEATVAVHISAEAQAQNAAHLVIELGSTYSTRLNQCKIGISKIVIVVGIAFACSQSIGIGAKFQVKTIENCLMRIFGSTPIGHQHAIEFPVGLENLVEILIVSTELVTVLIVCAHHSPSTTIDNGTPETFEIDFVQSPITDHYIHFVAVNFLIVEGEVLHTSSYAIALNTFYSFGCQDSRQERIFTHILEVAATERVAIDVDSRRESNVFVSLTEFFTNRLAIESSNVAVPACRHRHQGRVCRARVVGLAGSIPLIPQQFFAHALRSVVYCKVGYSKPRNTRRCELRLRMDHCNLLLKSKP